MQGMNLLVRRSDLQTPYVESGAVVSAVSGNLYRWSNGNPVNGAPAETGAASMGTVNPPLEGEFSLIAIPLLQNASAQDAFITSEPINPLYTGQYGLGPYLSAPVTPSGPTFPWRDNNVMPYEQNFYVWNVPGSEATCNATALGTAASPTPVAATGWWTNVLCGYGAISWSLVNVQASRNLSVEVTALDESSFVTENKLQPLIGAWNQTDAAGSLPIVAQAASPFNSIAAGLTLLNFDTPATGPLRIAITDQRGDGRPDYHFRARVLYADSISPAMTTSAGGLVTITGLGFRAGLTVTVGGASAQVIAATATTILAIAPAFAALGTGAALTADVTVLDPMSGGSTTLYGALTYPANSALPQTPALTLLTPAFYVASGQTVSISPLASLSQSGAAAPGIAVNWTSTSTSLTYPAGSQSISDTNGLATIAASVSSLPAGTLATGSACATIAASANLCGSFTVMAVDPSRWTVTAIQGAAQKVSATSILQPVVFQVTDGSGNPVIGAPVTIYQMVSGYQVCPAEGRCPVAPVYSTSQTTTNSDSNGLIVGTVQQISGSPQTTTLAASTGTQGFVSVTLQKTP
jgi:hypothetical protein